LSGLPWVLAAACVVGTGCAGSETGNGREDHDVGEVWLSLGAPELGGLRAESRDGTVFFIDMAEVGIVTIDLGYTGVDCPATDEVECDVDGKHSLGSDGWAADLLGGTLTPRLVLPAAIPTDKISGFKVRWEGSDGPTLRLEGELRLPGDERPVRFDAWVDVGGVTHFAVSEEDSVLQPHGWLLALDPSHWFDEVDVAACIQDGSMQATEDGVLHLEDGGPACKDITVAIARGFREDGKAQRKQR